jgi:catechol 2,3-dioxygenase-like lactoylglutathione lyase family enzyme
MFDHLSLGVADLDRAAAFYDAALAPLGYVRLGQNARSVVYGREGFRGEAPFAILAGGPGTQAPGPWFHLALAAPSPEAVELRPGYYAAFDRDPDGHRLEAVGHERIAD